MIFSWLNNIKYVKISRVALLTKKNKNMTENLNLNNKEHSPRKKLIICACSEGEERSVLAAQLFKKHGQNSKVLPGGLEGLESYLTGQDDPRKMERLLKRGVSSAFAIRGNNQDKEYERLLKRDATWLLFIGLDVEAKRFEKVVRKLRYSYDLDVTILNSWDKNSVTNSINKFLDKD